jgi:hypothetical protein
MNPIHRFLPPAAILLALALVSCDRITMTLEPKPTGPATWSYVEKGWGGVALGTPTIAADRMDLPLRLGVHPAERVDSAICVRRVSGHVEKDRIVVRVYKRICRGGPGSKTAAEGARDLTVHLGKPLPGKYAVVYNDASAGFPKIGEVEVR